MKAKYAIIAQVVLLAAVVSAGLILKSDLSSDGARLAHRTAGLLAGVAGITGIALIVKQGGSNLLKILSLASIALSLIAGMAGNALEGAGNYDSIFMVMRGGGVLALLTAVAVLVMISRQKPAE